MKSLKTFAAENNLIVSPVRYRHQFGYCKRKGYDLCRPDGKILAAFEPIELSDAKWYIRDKHEGYNGKRYINRITLKFLRGNINPEANSFFVNSSAKLAVSAAND